jgi:3'(2'), 5'-bisphosphate nucleotidase
VTADPGKSIAKSAAHPIHVRTPPPEAWVSATSRSHPDPETDEFLKRFPIARTIVAGSSLKFCLVAAGEADIYARAGRTMEWDTAAGHAVLKAAGGEVTRWDGSPFLYGKPGFQNGGFVAKAL